MTSIKRRRWRNIRIFLFLCVLVLAVHFVLNVSMYPSAWLSGWVLLALILGLASYNARKKLPFIPLARSATWLQIHIYAGLLTFPLFLVHIDYRVPNGLFEVSLALLYGGVFLSGVLGLILTRVIPQRLTTRGSEVIFERIPVYINKLRNEVESYVLESVSETETTAVPKFYLNRLQAFFERPRHFWLHLLHSNRPRQALLTDIKALGRYLNKVERERMVLIADRVRTKDDLDYQYSMQVVLKLWLFVHVPLTYALLIFAAFHVLLVHAFAGAIR